MAAQLATVRGALALDPGQQGGIKRVALSTITALASAAVLLLVLGGFFILGGSKLCEDIDCRTIHKR